MYYRRLRWWVVVSMVLCICVLVGVSAWCAAEGYSVDPLIPVIIAAILGLLTPFIFMKERK